jgi:hypothetical protein
MAMVDKHLHDLYRVRPDFVYSVSRDFARSCQTPMLVMPDDSPAHSYQTLPRYRLVGAERRGNSLPPGESPGAEGTDDHPKTSAAWRSCNWLEGSPERRLTVAPAFHGRPSPLA